MCSLLFLKATWQVYINLSTSDSTNKVIHRMPKPSLCSVSPPGKGVMEKGSNLLLTACL